MSNSSAISRSNRPFSLSGLGSSGWDFRVVYVIGWGDLRTVRIILTFAPSFEPSRPSVGEPSPRKLLELESERPEFAENRPEYVEEIDRKIKNFAAVDAQIQVERIIFLYAGDSKATILAD